MKKFTIFLIFILSFLFLHSELGFAKDCSDHHQNHDVCSILQNSDNVRSINIVDFFQHSPILFKNLFNDKFFFNPELTLSQNISPDFLENLFTNPPETIILLNTFLI